MQLWAMEHKQQLHELKLQQQHSIGWLRDKKVQLTFFSSFSLLQINCIFIHDHVSPIY